MFLRLQTAVPFRGGVLLCIVSLQVDLPTIWHGLGLWERCGNDKLHFHVYCYLLCLFVIFSLGNFGIPVYGPILGRASPLGRGTTVVFFWLFIGICLYALRIDIHLIYTLK